MGREDPSPYHHYASPFDAVGVFVVDECRASVETMAMTHAAHPCL